MANFEATTRTNYFRVTDIEKFQDVMSRAYGSDSKIQVLSLESEPPFLAFGCLGTITGFMKRDSRSGELEWYEDGYMDFLKALQPLLPEGEACIIITAGFCKLRDVSAAAVIITKDEIRELNLKDAAIHEAQNLLNNPDWETQFNY